MKTVISLLCLLLVSFGGLLAAEAEDRIDLSRNLDYRIDPAGTESIEAVARLPADAWVLSQGSAMNFGFRSEVFWFRLKLPDCAAAASKRVLEIAYPLLDRIDVWEIAPQSVPTHSRVGDSMPFKSRPINHIALAVPVGCAADTTLILRVSSTSAMQIPLILWNAEAFLAEAAQAQMPLFFYFGAMLVMAAYNTFVFISVRKLSYLFYVCFSLSLVAFQGGITGFGFRFLWPDMPIINDYIIDKSLNMATAFGLGFAIQYMRVKTYFPRLYRITQIFLWSLAFYQIVSFLLPYRIAIKISIAMIMSAIVLGCLANVKCILKRQREGYFYVLAWSAFVNAAVLLTVNKLGLLPRNIVTENGMQFATVLESLLMSFALVDQLNILRRNLDLSHKELQSTLDSIESIVKEKTSNIRSILDTVQQGIMTVRGRDLHIEAEFSPYTTRTLGLDQLSGLPVKQAFLDKLELNEDQRKCIESALLACLEESMIAFDLNASHFPHELRLSTPDGPRDLVIDWTPILRDQQTIDRFLIVFRDVTAWKKMESFQASQNEMLTKLQQMMKVDPLLLRKFLNHTEKMLDDHLSISMHVDPGTILKNLFIDIHTLKGESRSLGLQDLAEACHQLEDGMAQMRQGQLEMNHMNLQTHLLKTRDVLQSYLRIYQERLRGLISDGDVLVKGDMLLRWKQQLLDHDEIAFRHMLRDIHSILYLSFEQFQSKLRRWCRRISQDLGRPEPKLDIQSSLSHLDNRVSEVLDKIFIHLLQNALAHGIETAEVRKMHGKLPQGHIIIRFEANSRQVRITMRDDGRGFDQARIYRKASILGLVGSDRKLSLDRMKELVLTSGFSSLEAVHSYAGRGVGLDAVQGLVKQLGGTLDIELYAEVVPGYTPFEVIIDLPASSFPIAA